MSITLTYGSTVVTLGDKERQPFSRMLIAQQDVFETDAGTHVVYDYGDQYLSFDVNLENLTTTEKVNVESFWRIDVLKQARQWIFKDTLGRNYRVNFNSAELDLMMQEGGARWNAVLELRGDFVLGMYTADGTEYFTELIMHTADGTEYEVPAIMHTADGTEYTIL
jgi:hypothetical protein